MACNLVSGMFQRLDKLHKNGMASICVFGKDGDLAIAGVWMFRGQELAFDVSNYEKMMLCCLLRKKTT